MEKKKLDEVTKTKLIYSGELLIFAIAFFVIGTLQAVGVMNMSEGFLNVFKFLTLAGVAYFIFDFVTTFTNQKKKANACWVDKFSTIIIPPYILVVDILLISNNEFVWSNYKLFICPLIYYLGAVYLFQAIYHWFVPLKALFEEDEEENKNDDKVVDTQEPQTEETDKKDSE